MIISLGSDFCICLCCMGGLFLGFYLLKGVLESVMTVFCWLSWPAQLVCSQGTWLSRGMSSGIGGWDEAKCVGRRREGEDLWDLQEMELRDNTEICHRCSAAELDLRLGDWICGKRERRWSLKAAFLVVWQARPVVYSRGYQLEWGWE